MTEDDARSVWLLRACEWPEPAAPWSAAERDRVTAEALRAVGADAPLDRWLAARAASARPALERLAPSLRRLLHRGAASGTAVVGLMAAGLLLGLAIDALGNARRINLIHLPLLGMVAWNLVVLAALALRAVRPAGPSWLTVLLQRLWQQRERGRLDRAGPRAAAARFLGPWLEVSAPLRQLRIAAALHAAAALVALGAIAAMYLRGLALEYRAGWESTFLDAAQVHAWVQVVYAPAAALTGIALPDAEAIARLATGGPGENAARWIHLMAVTVTLFVVLPRAALALIGLQRVRRMAQYFPLPLDDAYIQALDRQRRNEELQVQVLPYGARLDADAQSALDARVRAAWGPSARPTFGATLAVGEEDALEECWPTTPAGTQTVVLMPLGATPEDEHHGAVLAALKARAAPDRPPGVWLDEAAFARRFEWAAGDRRLEERREAWRRFVAAHGLQAEFVRLEGDQR